MKFIVVGLGNFGSSLSLCLSEAGHEVLAVDQDMGKVDNIKNAVTHAVCIDCTDQHAIQNLPIKDTDTVIVTIGEDFGASIMTIALLKQQNPHRIIGRAISPVHSAVLESIGLDLIINPEMDSAQRLSNQIITEGSLGYYPVTEDSSLNEFRISSKYDGLTLQEIDFTTNFNLQILLIKKPAKNASFIGKLFRNTYISSIANNETIVEAGDIAIAYGKTSDIHNFLKNNEN